MDKDKSEFKLIEWIRRQTKPAAEGVRLGIGDDMAVLEVGGEKVLITTDTLLEGVHFILKGRMGSAHAEQEKEIKGSDPFKLTASLEQVGYKAMAVSLSDCAAMAAAPWVAVAAVSLPNEMSMPQARQLHKGLQKAAEKYNCPIVGGDTTSWDKPLALTVTMLARAKGIEPVLRSGAQIGDAIMVTGELGGSQAGKHLDFEPRVAEARELAKRAKIHALIDISDGLSIDLDHICRESKVAAVIKTQAVPISKAAQKSADPLKAALSDGEDFELLFCLSQTEVDKLLQLWHEKSLVPIKRIGHIISPDPQQEGRLFLQNQQGLLQPLAVRGWEHFKNI